MPAETIISELRLLGQRAYVAGMQAAAASAKRLDISAAGAGRTVSKFGSQLDKGASSLTRWGARGAVAAAGIGVALATVGLGFDAAMERSEVGMGTLLGSAKKGKELAEDVKDFALKAPLFGVEQMMDSAQQVLGAGLDSKAVVPALSTFSDTLSALGKNPEDLNRLTYAFQQMLTKGKVSAEELQGQLGEIFPAQKILAREMGISARELGDRMKAGAVRGKKPILLLLRGMEKEYAGGTERIAKTFDGMWANIKEQSKQTLGILFMPLFKELERDVFPALQDFSSEWTKVLSDQNLTAEQKWQETQDLYKSHLRPIVDETAALLSRADIPGHLMTALDAALPVMMSSFADAAPKVARSFLDAWLHADAWTKVLTATAILGKFGMFGYVGRKVADPFIEKFVAGLGGEAASAKLTAAGTASGRVFGKAAAFGAAAAFVYFLPDLSSELQKKLGVKKPDKGDWGGFFGRTLDELGRLKKIPGSIGDFFTGKNESDIDKLIEAERKKGHRQSGGTILSQGPYVVGETGPERAWLPSGTRIAPAIGGGGFDVPAQFFVNGRLVSQAVARYNVDAMARNGALH